jgi:dynamin 1-like protein
MQDALANETEFFANHPAYRNMAQRNGTKFLAKTLNQVRDVAVRLACTLTTESDRF